MLKQKKNKLKEIGIVSYQDIIFNEEPGLKLENGSFLKSFKLRYETYGKLNKDGSNAILIEHSLSSNHHVAGKYHPSDKKSGWWNSMIGPKKAFNTDQYFIICINCIGGCSGSTGPNSINPQTGEPYSLKFPMITIGDMVNAEIYLLDYLNIKQLFAICGSSMGGMKALHWSIYYPNRVKNLIAIATTASQNAQSIAFSEVARQAIMTDPNWKNGDYIHHQSLPKSGLSIARMMAHITYLSDASMRKKFGRKLQSKKNLDFTFDIEFEVESYLRHQGSKFIDFFDPNSYLYMSKALNYFDLESEFSSLKIAFSRASCRFLIISFSSDWLYPPYMSQNLVKAMTEAGKEASYVEVETDLGHDAFLLEFETITKLIKSFLY